MLIFCFLDEIWRKHPSYHIKQSGDDIWGWGPHGKVPHDIISPHALGTYIVEELSLPVRQHHLTQTHQKKKNIHTPHKTKDKHHANARTNSNAGPQNHKSN